MIVGVPKEIKTREYRVGMVPAGVRQLTSAGHTVLVETNAGVGSGIPDSEYQRVGAQIVASADELWKRAEMIVKVKEPIAPEYERIQNGQVIYTYFHLSGVDPELTRTAAILWSRDAYRPAAARALAAMVRDAYADSAPKRAR